MSEPCGETTCKPASGNDAAPDGARGLTFAVMIPAYNAERTIRATIDSALAQTRPADEVIVCNDGSTDNTAAVLAEYGDAITVIHQANAGVSAAENAVLEIARSDFVIKLDADDTWMPDRIRQIEEHLMSHPHLDIVTTDAWVVEDGVRLGRYYDDMVFPDEASQDVEILRGDFIFASAAVRRATVSALGGWDATRSHQCEYDAWIRMILAGSRAGLVPLPLACYNLSPNSLRTRVWAKHRSELTLFEGILKDARLRPAQVRAARHRADYHRRMLRNHDALEALRGRQSDRRAKCVAASLTAGQSLTLRAKFLAAAAAPGLAARRLSE